MATTIAENIIETLADQGVTHIWGVVGDALNPVVDAIRTEERIEWIGVRHEEVAAFAASAQAQLTDNVAVCMGTVGPGAIHLLNGLYDAKKAHAPVLAIVGQVPTPSINSAFFQEVHNDRLFADVACYTGTVTDAGQMPGMLAQALNAAYSQRGVAVLSLPANMGLEELPSYVKPVPIAPRSVEAAAADSDIEQAAKILNDSEKVTLFVGKGARGARTECLELADKLAAPMVITLQGKESLEHDNEFQVGQTGLIGNPAAVGALKSCDTLMLIGTDFPYSEWIPDDKTVIQLDISADHIGRRVAVDRALIGHSAPTVAKLLPLLDRKDDRGRLEKYTKEYELWLKGQHKLADPSHDESLVGKVRSMADNPEGKIRPEAVALALDKVCADDAVFSADTGMSTVWLARLLPMRHNRRLIGSFNLGSMANAMPMALAAQAENRDRQVIGMCGDGGLMMLLGDLRTAVTYKLPVTLVVFNNSRLGMVKLEQEEMGLPEYGTELDNPSFTEVGKAMGLTSMRVTEPEDLEGVLAKAVATNEPVLVEVMTNPEEVAVPGRTDAGQVFGFAKAKVKEMLD